MEYHTCKLQRDLTLNYIIYANILKVDNIILCVTIATHFLHRLFCMLFVFTSQENAPYESACGFRKRMLCRYLTFNILTNTRQQNIEAKYK